jgi:hypothetical protein
MVQLVELDFASGFLRLHSGSKQVTWNGYAWSGAGQVMKIEPASEGVDLQARGVAITLSGLASGLLSKALTENYRSRSARIWAAPLDTTTYATLADPILIWAGRMDNMQVALGDTATIALHCESRLADWNRPRVRRYNDGDQQSEYAGDLGFNFVASTADKTYVWGQPVSQAMIEWYRANGWGP